jgi:23S rRNA (uridine2552-2'-O)-methyltransferase
MADKPKKNKSIRAWVNRHVTDHYVNLAQKDKYRSRAAYKLLEISKEFEIFKHVKRVVDLGCAPGSWSQVACKVVGSGGMVVGVDLLAIEPIPGLHFVKGDFTEELTLKSLVQAINNELVDLVISDMSPNLSGIKGVDQARLAGLVELVLVFSHDYLKTGGACLVKVFYGGEFDGLLKNMRELFNRVVTIKPNASRSESSEVYLLGLDKKQRST